MDVKVTADLNEGFFARLDTVCAELECAPLDMLAVMMSESGVRAEARNPNGDASGLIQFMPRTLVNLGWRAGASAFRGLSAVDQLPYVRRYFGPYRGKLGNAARIYVATFLPVHLNTATADDYVLAAREGPYGWAYAPNAVFDKDGDLRITVAELKMAILRNCRGARWDEIVERVTRGAPQPERPNAVFDLRTVRGIQEALLAAGFSPGSPDGYGGPRTVDAVKQFQAARGLTVDGVVGPATRAALGTDLSTRGLGHA